MKRVYLLRHAKAEIGTARMSDRERRLAPRGVENAQSLGILINNRKMKFDRVLCSSSERTRETIAAINAQQATPFAVEYQDQLYLASPGDLIHTLQILPETIQSVLIIGHNPGIHQLCLTLAQSGEPDAMGEVELKYATCGFAILECEVNQWAQLAPGCAHLAHYLNRHHVAALLEI